MKNKAKIQAVLAVLGMSFVISGCPYYHRPHVPHPRLPLDSMLQLEQQNNAEKLSWRVTETAVARIA